MGPGMKQVVGFGDRSSGGGNFGDKCGTPYSKVCEPSKLQFEVVCGIGQGIGVHIVQEKRRFWGFLFPNFTIGFALHDG